MTKRLCNSCVFPAALDCRRLSYSRFWSDLDTSKLHEFFNTSNECFICSYKFLLVQIDSPVLRLPQVEDCLQRVLLKIGHGRFKAESTEKIPILKIWVTFRSPTRCNLSQYFSGRRSQRRRRLRANVLWRVRRRPRLYNTLSFFVLSSSYLFALRSST